MAVLPTMTASAVLPAASSKNSVIGTTADAETQVKARGTVRDIVRKNPDLTRKEGENNDCFVVASQI